MSKADREILFNKYGGKCAYCGCELTKGWHVDHVQPVVRNHKTVWNPNKSHYVRVATEMVYPHLDCMENKMPACAKCNINKHSDTIEEFRRNIARYLESLNKRMVQYQMAKKYGLIQETGTEVKFYFETYNQQPK